MDFDTQTGMQHSQNGAGAASPPPPPAPAEESIQDPALNLEDMDSTEPDHYLTKAHLLIEVSGQRSPQHPLPLKFRCTKNSTGMPMKTYRAKVHRNPWLHTLPVTNLL